MGLKDHKIIWFYVIILSLLIFLIWLSFFKKYYLSSSADYQDRSLRQIFGDFTNVVKNN